MPKIAEKTDCIYCGKETEWIHECPECAREGCYECMPMGVGISCPECEEAEDAKAD